MNTIKIIGAGLAGCEAALKLADSGWQVTLFEMRPQLQTQAHETDKFAEIVCSNSFKSKLITTASGLLKEEMKLLGCKLLPIAERCSVPAGNALAVDRYKFSELTTAIIANHPNIKIVRSEVTSLDDDLTIIAAGPLISAKLTKNLIELIGEEQLYFFDAIAPIVEAESIDSNIVYSKTRYDKGEADYLNCPFSRDEYYHFVEALNAGEKHEAHEFEMEFFEKIRFQFYENCTPIEELAKRGKDTLRFGVMRPVGLEDPRDGKRPFAVIQLRVENKNKTSFNLVGCQTMLKYGEQKRIFRLIPGLREAEFLRFGSIHRNTFLNSPQILNPDLSLKAKPNIFLAGQLAGVEGYVESILGGILVAENVKKNSSAASDVSQSSEQQGSGKGEIIKSDLNSNSMILPETTISGQLWRHLITPAENFQPMNANFGLLPLLTEKIRDKKLKKQKLAERSLQELGNFLQILPIDPAF